MPILSLQFLKDLSLAYAWVNAKGLSPLTPAYYALMIKYRKAHEFPGGRYPLPLDSLGVPPNAIDDPNVAALARRIYGSALAFIVAHELGHVYYRHPPNLDVAPNQSREHEVEADSFAFQLLARIGLPPVGISIFFDLLSHLEQNRYDFDTEWQYAQYLMTATHPLTSTRLLELGRELEGHAKEFSVEESGRETIVSAGREIVELAKLMDDRDMQKANRDIGRGVAALAPRGFGKPLAALPEPVCLQAEGLGDWSGTYEGVWTTTGSSEVHMRVTLCPSGNRLFGYYSFGIGVGTIHGSVERDGRLYFQWDLGDESGHGVLERDARTADLRGSWGAGGNPRTRGNLRFHREPP